jgi:hypothetical protein
MQIKRFCRFDKGTRKRVMRRTTGKVAAVMAGLAIMVLSVDAAWAQGRPDVRAMTCADARALVWQKGAAVLTTGRHTYDRYVVSERFCPLGHMTRRAWVQTRDMQSCSIGYICVLNTEREDRRWWLRPR